MGSEKDKSAERYPYTHHGPAINGSKLADFLISEISLIEDGLMEDTQCEPKEPTNVSQ